jgi:hypothetical protein
MQVHKKMTHRVQGIVVAAAERSRLFYRFFAAFYSFALRALPRLAGNGSSLYLRQGLLEPNWTPGASDIDTLWVFDADTDRRFAEDTRRLTRRLDGLKRFWPFLGEAQVSDRAALAAYLTGGDAKRFTAAAWRRLGGPEARPGRGAALPADARAAAWSRWTQAAESFERLLQCLWVPDARWTPAEDVAFRKHAADVHRWLAPTEDPSAAPPSRDDVLGRLGWSAPDGRRAWTAEERARKAAETHAALSAEAGRRAPSAAPGAAEPKLWPSRARDDAWESQAGEKRLESLRASLGPGVRNLAWNTLGRTWVLLDDAVSETDFAAAALVLRRLKGIDPGLRGPVTLAGGSLFRRRLWSVYEGTGLAAWGLRTDAAADRATAWRRSARPLLARVFSGQARRVESAAPPAGVLTALSREAAANWLMHWPNAPALSGPDAGLYGWVRLVAPALSLRLWLEAGLAGDPADIEGMAAAHAAAFPAERDWTDDVERALDRDSFDGDLRGFLDRNWAGFHRAARALAALAGRTGTQAEARVSR